MSCLKLTLDHTAPWTVNLKRQTVNRSIFVESDYTIQLTKNFKGIARLAMVHAMWDESETVDGFRLAFGLYKNHVALEAATSCEYKVYEVSNNATPWVPTLIKSGTLAIGTDGLFKVSVDATDIGESPIGDITFLVKATITYGSESFEVAEYFNHLGITSYTQFLKRKIQFVDLTKKSTGEP